MQPPKRIYFSPRDRCMLNEVVSAAHQATGHTVPREEMMVKKSLADMVKQEAEKAGSPPPESADTDHQINTSTSPRDNTSSSRPTPTQAELEAQMELEAQVAWLESHLQQSQETEQTLKKEISALQLTVKNAQASHRQLATTINKLQQELEEKNKLIAQLKQETEAAAALKEKLEQAELIALHLSETNTKILQHIEQLKLESSTSKLAQKPTKRSPPHLVPRPEHSLSQPMNNEDFSQSTWLL
ncbi:hypothetical protein [Limnospira fusiformis]|uniref:hypothetical protein n=1 Tax=Limnospira fusiformis TaxID=54297 RepID=UPI0034E06186